LGVKQNTAIICLSPYSGGMELDAIKLAKKGAFIESKKDEFVGFNGIKLETISFKSSFSLNIILNARKIIKKYNIKILNSIRGEPNDICRS